VRKKLAHAKCRTNSQKPSDELYANFRASFPQLGSSVKTSAGPSHAQTSLTDALDVAVTSRYVLPDICVAAPFPIRSAAQLFGPSKKMGAAFKQPWRCITGILQTIHFIRLHIR